MAVCQRLYVGSDLLPAHTRCVTLVKKCVRNDLGRTMYVEDLNQGQLFEDVSVLSAYAD